MTLPILLAALVIPTSAQAQAGPSEVSKPRQGSVKTEAPADRDEFKADAGRPGSVTPTTSAMAIDGTALATEVTTKALPRESANGIVKSSQAPDFNSSIFYKNKLELSLEGGWLPVNVPFVFDVFLGDGYTMTSLKYTLVPVIASLRWQFDDVGGPWIFRGNWDLSCSGSVTAIPRGPESRYFAYIMGIRRNFVPRRGRLAPYFDYRLGMGNIDAKGPQGVAFAQGQDFTFTMNMGSGARYAFNPRYSISAGLDWMHISNLYLSEPKYRNYGINVYGPVVGIDIRLGHGRREAAQ